MGNTFHYLVKVEVTAKKSLEVEKKKGWDASSECWHAVQGQVAAMNCESLSTWRDKSAWTYWLCHWIKGFKGVLERKSLCLVIAVCWRSTGSRHHWGASLEQNLYVFVETEGGCSEFTVCPKEGFSNATQEAPREIWFCGCSAVVETEVYFLWWRGHTERAHSFAFWYRLSRGKELWSLSFLDTFTLKWWANGFLFLPLTTQS